MEKLRPNPDQLLLTVQKEQQRDARGKLKIYLGAAPGVGKTYSMLQDAYERRQDGLDVVLGIIESHGRVEIEALIEKFEMIPKATHEYHGKLLSELDLNAILKRNPGLVLIDELAHTNIPGLRHDKRWQDIEEALAHGIDVYTTLNVQHIESLNDIIADITQIHIRETVPDSLLDSADSLELVDLSPDELLIRLAEGKVYFPAQAEIAKENFFKIGNLIALRELALRVAAKYAGSKVISYRQEQGIHSVWPTQEKILACIGYNSNAMKIIREARRMADTMQTDLFVVFVDSPRITTSHAQRDEAIHYLRFAEQLGAQTRILTGLDIVSSIMEFARSQNITQIVIGKKNRPWWKRILHRNVTDELIRKSEEIDVYVITETLTSTNHIQTTPSKKKVSWKTYGIAIALLALATGINFILFPFLAASDLIMIYMLATTLVALQGERDPAILASILSVIIYDFCFVPPLYSFTVANIHYLLTLLVMLVVSQIISYLTVLSRRQAEIAHEAEYYTSALYTLSHKLARTRGSQPLLEIGTQTIADVFDCKADILLSDVDKTTLSDKEKGIAQWVYDLRKNAGWGTHTLSYLDALYVPMIASQSVVGVLRISPHHRDRFYTPDQMRLLESFTHQIALAFEVDKNAL
ncbi:MAG TPA: DUF4118 domain-containing protein [Gammaproteobacteria bacterium]|nr:DUF4118 domain-containing protein [Gammaproteobacteria bacterium]